MEQGARTFLPAIPSVAAAAEDSRAPGASFIPLALVGGPLPQSQMPLLDAIERAGGRVVLNATEAGERSLWQASPLDQAQPDDGALALLTRSYLANCVEAFQRPNTRLYDWLRPRLSARQVRGIVLWHYVACDLWRAEAQPMREAFGLPVLLLDADEAAPNRTTSRLEAFLESLQ
jgi:benzoyl-CoA reductase/2-hydroxyglutaryl-CoA dehydratase subunit BcrC/BadD/HgdB